MFKIFIRKLKKLFGMKTQTLQEWVIKIEDELGVELALPEEEWIETLFLQGHPYETIAALIKFHRRKNRLKTLLIRAGYSYQEILEIIENHRKDLEKSAKIQGIFDTIKNNNLKKKLG